MQKYFQKLELIGPIWLNRCLIPVIFRNIKIVVGMRQLNKIRVLEYLEYLDWVDYPRNSSLSLVYRCLQCRSIKSCVGQSQEALKKHSCLAFGEKLLLLEDQPQWDSHPNSHKTYIWYGWHIGALSTLTH